ncbi:cell surface protein SprA [Bacteroidales bacterium OttesenSCG-928-A17]|nr:cell surface protein SprA [Bacteroidales bacterium OttesenSCG-928-A17]
MKFRTKHIIIGSIILFAGSFYTLNADLSIYGSQAELPEISLVEEMPESPQNVVPADTVKTRFPVSPVVPKERDDLNRSYPIDLNTPQNLNQEFKFNPQSNRYELGSKIGDMEISTPYSMTREEYMDYVMRKSLESYFREKYEEERINRDGKGNDALSAFDFDFDLGPAEKLFGPGGVKLNAQGSVLVKLGATNTKTANPTLSERQRNRTSFDFDTQVQTNIGASVGDKINFDLNYNTEATFGFDSKKLKLGYEGKEDEIIKVLEAGNVSMNTSNSLIRGGTALFGIKTELQFGKLTVGAVFSQQESEARTTSSKGNTKSELFELSVDAYDNNQHFLLGHYFYSTYDGSMRSLPLIRSGISIDRIEVWVTNKRGNFDDSRDIVAFTDLGESSGHINNTAFVTPLTPDSIPHNRTNNLYARLQDEFPNARDFSLVNQVLETAGLVNGEDYEKIGKARKLNSSEYSLNSQLGYISLRTELQADEVLGVAYSYTYKGQDYQVGEFSSDNPSGSTENLYVKLLKSTANSPSAATWKLMMKNFYTINRRSTLERSNFRLDVKYQNDTTGTYLNYITEGNIANQMLLKVLRLDRLDSRNETHPDGFFDYVEGFTAFSQTGRIAFPVIEPFGSFLETAIGNPAIAEKYVFKELYDSTLTVAQQTAEKNKFILQGEYKGSGGNSIKLDGYNLTRGSVTVTANGVILKENVDYTVDYASGNVTIINPLYEGAKIDISSEDKSEFGARQRKTMMGLNLDYKFNPNFNIGATVMNYSEMPTTTKAAPGMESVNNTLFGFNLNYATQSQALTNLLDKLPLLDLTAPSQISLSAEYAQLIAGHYKSEYGGDHSYIDDFEKAKSIIDLRSPYSWNLASTPSMFDESKEVNNLAYGYNRSLLAWYNIDALFTRKSSLTPVHIKNDLDQLSNHYVREIYETELFPNKDARFDQSPTIPVLNLAFYPKERGPYNLDADGMGADGKLLNPEKRWGGITRKIESGQTDFESRNIEMLEFWLLDPFIYEPNSKGGDLYINLGEISEDVLKDEKKFFENGIPIDRDPAKVDTTVWGVVPKQQSLVYAFDNSEGSRKLQDVGLNGLTTEEEFNFSSYKNYLEKLAAKLSPQTMAEMQSDPFSPLNDPAGDNYHYYRGSDYDQAQMSILARYKRYNGTEGNSPDTNESPESYSTAAKLTPDIEDINQDNTLNEGEKYFQYKIELHPGMDIENHKFISQKMEVVPSLKNGDEKTITWYQFKIPLNEFEDRVGGIRDFKSIRFMRMFLTNFADSVILRFGTLQLTYGDWRMYTKDLSNPNLPPQGNTSFNMAVVNIEENGDKEPVNYIMPPGVNRILDPGQPQLTQENEQALSINVSNLSPGDARAIYKSSGMDARQYRRLQMFVHAEKLAEDLTNLQDNELSIFLRLGSDYKNNYYEYEIPLSITPEGRYNQGNNSDRKIVWPEENMFDFAFELLTNLKLERNKEKRKAGSDVTFYTPYSGYDPNKPMNKVTVLGNPTISDIKVIMIGVRNNSRNNKSAEIWFNELRLTDFNEDGGWAGNVNLFLGLSDLGSVNFSGRKETAGFGGLDQGIMDRNLDDTHQVSVATQIQLGKFFPEKAKVNLPLSYSYREEVISPKYDPLDQDILLKDALDTYETKEERDSVKNMSVEKETSRSVGLNNVKVDIRSKSPMPYDPANFTFNYSHTESNIQDATTMYDRKKSTRLAFDYLYVPSVKPWQPFVKSSNKQAGGKTSARNRAQGGARTFFNDISINYLPQSIRFSSEISRDYSELQLRDIGTTGENMIEATFQEDFYWRRDASIQWNLTKNLNMNFTTGTNAQIETPHEQVNKQFNKDGYELWKDSVIQSLRHLGTPLDYNQAFQATYALPFKSIPILNFITGNLKFTSTYNWDRGAQIEFDEEEEGTDTELGNTIRNSRIVGMDNISFNLLNLYNKNKFLADVNKKYTQSRTNSSQNTRNARQASANKAEAEKRKKKYEGTIHLNTDSATVVKHQLNNKRLRVTARGPNGRIYELKYKAVDANSIKINTKDSVELKLTINQLPPIEESRWYKIAQGTTRALMMLRSFGFSYNETAEMMIPNFRPGIGNFNGQGSTPAGHAPGFDFAFGLVGESYLQRALDNDWLIKNEEDVTPAMFNNSQTLTFNAVVEPFAGFQINLNGSYTKTNQKQVYFMYENQQEKYSGNFRMSTIALSSGFESLNAKNGYYSPSFQKFLDNRAIIAGRLEQIYSGTNYPNAGFLANTSIAGQPYDPNLGQVDLNSADVLIPAFIAAYTGKNAGSVGLTAFPSLKSVLPNWSATYTGFMQLPFFKKHFKSFAVNHKYECNYMVGAFSSFLSWVPSDVDGIGYIRSTTTDNPSPSSPYEIASVSITEALNPLIGISSSFQNNASLNIRHNRTHNVTLSMSSYQIVEVLSNEFVFGMGYRFENFNQILKIRSTGGANFNNELKVALDISFRKQQNLIRKIEDNFTQVQSGDTHTTLKFSADYNLSKLVTLQAFFDRQISNPLISTSYPITKTSFGISCKVSLAR